MGKPHWYDGTEPEPAPEPRAPRPGRWPYGWDGEETFDVMRRPDGGLTVLVGPYTAHPMATDYDESGRPGREWEPTPLEVLGMEPADAGDRDVVLAVADVVAGVVEARRGAEARAGARAREAEALRQMDERAAMRDRS